MTAVQQHDDTVYIIKYADNTRPISTVYQKNNGIRTYVATMDKHDITRAAVQQHNNSTTVHRYDNSTQP